jgi:SAM-dependent methyltransferase
MTMANVAYDSSSVAWGKYDSFIKDLIEREGVAVACEVGGGANPTLPLEYIEQTGIEYVIMDVSQRELDKAPARYTKILRDIQHPVSGGYGGFDLVFSRMLAEHVRDGEAFHRNVYALLRPGGLAVHFFPTLFAPPFVLNRLLPEHLGERVLHLVQSGRERSGKQGKFPAFYSWCRGPTRFQITRLQALGYDVVSYIGFFGHAGYYKKVPAIERLHLAFSDWLVSHPIPQLTSFSWVVLRKAELSGGS